MKFVRLGAVGRCAAFPALNVSSLGIRECLNKDMRRGTWALDTSHLSTSIRARRTLWCNDWLRYLQGRRLHRARDDEVDISVEMC